jgi:hypothetical protein
LGVSNLTAIFGNTAEKPAGASDKLRELYWNREELKKELSNLRDEKYRLQECIQEKEGASARLRQELEHLESLLLDPDNAYKVLAHYQFRKLNLCCKSKLANFAEHLKQQREQRSYSSLLAGWNDQKDEEASAVEQTISEQRLKVQILEDQLQAERHRLSLSNGLLKLFRRRSVTRAVESVEAALEAEQQRERELLLKLEEIQKRMPPDTKGLDLETKRLINFMILSFAQQLFLHFSEDGIAAMSQESVEKSIGAINYGNKSDCDDWLAKIVKLTEKYEKLPDFADVLRRRAQLIAEKALFRIEDDAVPESGTVTTLYIISSNGVVQETETNLLGANYWDVSNVLSR